MSEKISLAKFSLAGPRGENQDIGEAVALGSDVAYGLVADGVGGLEGGRLAAACVSRAAAEVAKLKEFDPQEVITKAHAYVNRLPNDRVATTATVVLCTQSLLKFAHTGDSRAYIVRGAGLKTLTHDQTEAAFLVKEGVLTPSAARAYHRRNVLTHAVQKNEPLSLETGNFIIKPGDRILLLTDGVYKVMGKKRIYEISSDTPDAASFCNNVREEIEGKLEDDSTMVVIDIG